MSRAGLVLSREFLPPDGLRRFHCDCFVVALHLHASDLDCAATRKDKKTSLEYELGRKSVAYGGLLGRPEAHETFSLLSALVRRCDTCTEKTRQMRRSNHAE